MDKKKILITGGLGYVGGRLVKGLEANHTLLISSRNEPAPQVREVFPNAEFVLHSSLFDTTRFPQGVDTLIHLAATNEQDSVRYPAEAIDINVNQTRQIVDQAIRHGVKRIIYFSTIHVYGRSHSTEYLTEATLPRPVHPYAITHRAAEDYITAAHDSGKMEGIVVRLSNSFGCPVLPSVNGWMLLVNDICRQAAVTGEIRLKSNGCQYRDFITLADVTRAVACIIDTGLNGKNNIYNLCSEQSITVMNMVKQVAGAAEQLWNKPIPVILPEGVSPTDEPFYTIKADRMRSIGFVAANLFEEELTALLKFCRQHFTV